MTKLEEKLLEIIEGAIACRYYGGGASFHDYGYEGNWIVPPWATVSLLVRGRTAITFKNGVTLVRGAGEAVYMPAGTERRSKTLSTDGVELLGAWVAFTVFNGIDALSFFDVPPVFGRDMAERLGDLLRALAECSKEEDGPIFEVAIKRQRLLYCLLWLIVGVSRPKEGALRAMVFLERLSPALTYIKERFRETLTVEDIAKTVHLSKSRFHRVFKAAFAVAPLDYQKRLRLKEARESLLCGGLSVAEVAERVGYGDPFHFSRIFKDHFGVCPKRFRQENGVANFDF